MVKIEPQELQARLRQIMFSRFLMRELTTLVSDPQCTQTMSTYWHTADKNSSGKPFEMVDKDKYDVLLYLF